ncbi:FAD-binding oxidoreductase [Actinokineospora sp. UTMC 2448]|uniref:NAD(P)/FAD-dependent oxidoreductase n=1 Tax=Actinokineospora sp. UTMC 2448 TaxID=2268449 RepID=UPI002164C181|nr:FAD-dependent oxidoreductase [Actinokineospora sp. UTMC 2448]UVS77489.1 Monomeric sarcosine oxidase [Actinokineospora sp. UTMC 2448]
MRIVMVGGGVIALLTAMDCVSAGHDVILLDQGDIPFTGATSFDRNRVIRAQHTDDPDARVAAVRAHYRWIELESLLSTRIYERIGSLTMNATDRIPGARVVGTDELAAYPTVAFPDGATALHESHAGILLADRLLAACAGWLRWHPRAELRPHRRVVAVDADRATVRFADGGELAGDAVLVAIGPWSRDLLDPAIAGELVLRRQSMIYCDVPDPAAWAGVPTIRSLGPTEGAWLVPPIAGAALKLSADSACRVVDEVGDNTTPPHWRDHLIEVFADIVPGVRRDHVIDARDCYYLSRESTKGAMVAALGDRVLSHAACGGTSFKFAPLIARSLAQRLTGVDPEPTGIASLDRVVRPSLTRGVS